MVKIIMKNKTDFLEYKSVILMVITCLFIIIFTISGARAQEGCGADKFVCYDGSCVTNLQDCCPPFQSRCPNGTCASFCPPLDTNGCYVGEFQCSNGKCVSDQSLCPENSTACPLDKPIQCSVDKSCVALQTDCPCEIAKCPDGTCVSDASLCGCLNTQTKCPDGSCKDNANECCTNGQVLTNGICTNPTTSSQGCATNEFTCPDGSCVAEESSCKPTFNINIEFNKILLSLKELLKSSRTSRNLTKSIQQCIVNIKNNLTAEDCVSSVNNEINLLKASLEKIDRKTCDSKHRQSCIPKEAAANFTSSANDFINEINSALPEACGSK